MSFKIIAGVKKRHTPTPANRQTKTNVSYIYIYLLKYLNDSIQFCGGDVIG